MTNTLNPALLASDFDATLNDAARLQQEYRQSTLMPELILLALLRRRDTPAARALAMFESSRGVELEQLERQVHLACANRRDAGGRLGFVTGDGRQVPLSRQSIILIDDALAAAGKQNDMRVDSAHILQMLASDNVSTSGLLRPHGITGRTVADVLATLRPNDPVSGGADAHNHASVEQDNPPRAVYEREELLRTMLNIITQAINRHVILVGPAGVGKRTLAASLGMLIDRGEGPRGIHGFVRIAEAELLDDDLKAMRNGLDRARGGILCLPNLQRFFGGPGKAQFTRSTALIQKTFLGTDPVLIATASDSDWDAKLAGEQTVSEHSQVLRVPEPSISETIEMLIRLRPQLESDYKLQIADEALSLAAGLAKRYLAAMPLPRSAESLLHRSAALVNMSKQTQLAYRPELADGSTLDAEDIMLSASQMTGVPVNKLGEDERLRYASMVEHLKERLIGQDRAVLAVSRAIKTARVGLKEPQRPIGSFLFLGPTGVGKTELARTLASFMFGSESAMLALDMSEFKDEASLNRLLGSPSGYVDSAAGGQLTERVRKQPYLIVLFDEVEKAHPRVMDLLLQMIEEGRLSDGRGRSASFSDTVLILTSNLGSKVLATPVVSEQVRDAAMEQVHTWFRPELLNRLDEIVMFNALGPEDLGAILRLMLRREQDLARERGLQLEFSEAAMQWLQQQNEEPQYGARPLLRIIRRAVRVPLADFLLRANPPGNTTICIDADAAGLTFVTIGADGRQVSLQD